MVSEDAKDPEQEISLPTVIKSCFSVKVKKLKKLVSSSKLQNVLLCYAFRTCPHSSIYVFNWLYMKWLSCFPLILPLSCLCLFVLCLIFIIH